MSVKMGKSSISMFDREGNYLGKWGPSDEPGFALGAHTLYFIDGCFWTVDRDGHMVKKYSRDGELLLSLGTLGKPGDAPYLFNGPTGVVVQKNGNIVITDGYWNSRMIWYSPEGEYIREIGGWGDAPGQFNSPHAVAQTPDGRLLVVDFKGGAMHPYMTVPGQIAEHRKVTNPDRQSRVQVFDPDGKFLEQWTHITPPASPSTATASTPAMSITIWSCSTPRPSRNSSGMRTWRSTSTRWPWTSTATSTRRPSTPSTLAPGAAGKGPRTIAGRGRPPCSPLNSGPR